MSVGFENILVIDTAMNTCCAGVYTGKDKKRVSKAVAMAKGHAEWLMPLIEETLKEAGRAYSDLDAVGVTIGPGAFTGLRIGISAARAMSLALDIPAFGITTTQALASQYAAEKKPRENIGVIIETKRDDFYFQTFTEVGKPLNEAAAVPAAVIVGILNVSPFVAIGDGAARFASEAAKKPKIEDYGTLDAGFLAELLYSDRGQGVFVHSAEPLYLRGADVTTSKKPQRALAGK